MHDIRGNLDSLIIRARAGTLISGTIIDCIRQFYDTTDFKEDILSNPYWLRTTARTQYPASKSKTNVLNPSDHACGTDRTSSQVITTK